MSSSLALLPALDMSEIHILTTAHALAIETSSPAHPIWDLYDSGASHHMSPCHKDFVNFHEIAPRPDVMMSYILRINKTMR